VLVNEENVMFETGVKMSLKTKLTYNRVMVTVYVSIYAIHPLEDLSNHAGEGLWERDANSAGENGLVVYVALNPTHEVFNVRWCWHFRWPLVVFGVLPQILESKEF
jgi:hypothetical protein